MKQSFVWVSQAPPVVAPAKGSSTSPAQQEKMFRHSSPLQISSLSYTSVTLMAFLPCEMRSHAQVGMIQFLHAEKLVEAEQFQHVAIKTIKTGIFIPKGI